MLFAAVRHLLNLLLAVLEAAFEQDPRLGGKGTERQRQQDEDNFYSTNNANSNTQKTLDAAYEFLELTRPTTEEALKKQFKKLSLRYHPDRNGGSEESKEKMQKLNACVEIIEKDLTGVYGDENHNSPRAGPGAGRGSDSEEEVQEHHPPEPTTAKSRKAARRRYNAFRKKMQREMEAAMREEMKRQEERRREYNSKKRSEKQRCREQARKNNLNRESGIQNAHEEFVNQVKRRQAAKSNGNRRNSSDKVPDRSSSSESMDDIDEGGATSSSTTPQATPRLTQTAGKPKNLVMDCNSETIVVALRCNFPDEAIALLKQNFEQHMHMCMLELKREMRRQNNYNLTFSREQAVLQFLSREMDADSNTLLHYATYYESYEVMACIFSLASGYDILDEAIHLKNTYGETPVFFAELADDPSILRFINYNLEIIQDKKEKSEYFYMFKAAGKRLVGMYDVVAVPMIIQTGLTLYFMMKVLAMHWTAIVIAMSVVLFYKKAGIELGKLQVATSANPLVSEPSNVATVLFVKSLYWGIGALRLYLNLGRFWTLVLVLVLIKLFIFSGFYPSHWKLKIMPDPKVWKSMGNAYFVLWFLKSIGEPLSTLMTAITPKQLSTSYNQWAGTFVWICTIAISLIWSRSLSFLFGGTEDEDGFVLDNFARGASPEAMIGGSASEF